ncbi:hypothetical protein [Nocardiopsis aegyptia]|uniref:Broad specificity phosphatase PhoE n=1 Tax=Nocardiopsis aegyptia TaxID=220378 RepID=A0A7Z0ERE7_9ACTN|nr:hypothetical protein [Nocardiopsis aegyptia]NYJ36366.1 broad specificity phosphatase PhoE [Nocardiopsis aegyptia]
MSEQPVVQPLEAPLIPRPDPNPTTLRAAVAQVAPSRLKEFDTSLLEASTKAQANQSIGPLWLFCRSWAQKVQVQRYPDVARRLDEMVARVEQGHSESIEALTEVSRILAWADAELDK